MSIPLEPIMALIGATPGIRLIELVDQLDQDKDAIERALAPALADGSVLALDVPIFGGRTIESYTLGAVRPGQHESAASPAEEQKPTPAPEATAPATTTLSKLRGVRREQRAARSDNGSTEPLAIQALAFIRSQPGRKASNDDLRKALGLPKGKYASNYFRRYIEDGTLVRVRDGWAATPLDVGGRAKDGVSDLARAAALDWESRKPVVAAPESDAAPTGDITDAAKTNDPTVAAAGMAPVAPQDLRYALWSDGMLELRRGGQTLAILTVAERIALRAFLAVGAPA